MLVKVAALFSPKIKLGVEGRENGIERMKLALTNKDPRRPLAWFHAASLGEFEQGRPVIEAYKQQYPDHFILLTFFSPSGYEIRKNYPGADYICYLPIDSRANVRRFLEVAQPRIAFFIKYEFWYNYLHELRKSGCYVLSFSSIFRPGQIFFKPYGSLNRKMLRWIDHFFVQNEESVLLLKSIGIHNTSIAGDTRFDRVKTLAAQARNLPEISRFKNEELCLIAGSVWPADMQVIIPVLNQLSGKLKAVIAPHEIKNEEIASWQNQLNGSTVRYSEIKAETKLEDFDYLMIDNIGMLSSLYKYGDMAYIGGSFGAGLHNILEAATFWLPIIFGNKSYARFQEAINLEQLGGAFPVSGKEEILEIIKTWLSEPECRISAGKISERYVSSGTGATAKIMEKVKTILG